MRKLSNRFINVFYLPLVVISLFGAVSFLLNQLYMLQAKNILIIDVFLIIIGICYLIKWGKIKAAIDLTVKRLESRNIKRGLVILILIWQLVMIWSISGFSTWDPGIIILQATGQSQWVPNYFSYYQNTLPLMFFEHLVWQLIGSPSYKVLTIVLNVINMILVDTSVYLLLKHEKQRLSKETLNYISICICLLMLITPWICLPYSDPLSFAFTTFVYLGLRSLNERYSILKAIIVGTLITVNYFIKPSTVIILIAYIIVSFAFNISNKKLIINLFKKLTIIFATMVVLISGFNLYKSHNSIIKIDNSKSLNLVHFADMGIQGTGGYYLPDVDHDIKIKDPKERLKSDREIWLKRFNQMGPLKYQAFLVRKQVANTEDSSFHWGKEGEFIRRKNFTGSQYFLPRKLFLDNDGIARKYQEAFAIVIQLCWIILLANLVFALQKSDYNSQFLKYAIVGFFAFLLIFESGRSRYLIQFLPLIILLSGTGYENLKTKKNVYIRQSL
ncbi:hypothetical protein QUW34_05415 [Limosilactobacillus vaginalis]|nr:hypothetical protein [Limosilactobacillus vaginalis]MDM8304015.1 hypothetical protein [Limosilactobacillus vaginalis]